MFPEQLGRNSLALVSLVVALRPGILRTLEELE
jgi:hypothetical protein